MAYTYVYHLQSLRPVIRLPTQRINFSMRPKNMRMTRSFDVYFLENHCEYPHKLDTVRN